MPDEKSATATATATAEPDKAAQATESAKTAAATTATAASTQADAGNKDTKAADSGADKKEQVKEQQYAEVKKEDLKLPEGSLLDPKVVDEIVSFSKENKLSKEATQVLLERENKMFSSYIDGEKAKLTQVQNSWTEASRTDSEIGGEKFGENVECAHRVFKHYGDETLQKFVDETKLGNHPAVLRFINRIGRELGVLDGDFVRNNNTATSLKKDAATALYGATSSQEKESK